MPKVIHIGRLRYYWPLYALVLPSALLVAVFAYYPAISAAYHAFFRWNGDDINYLVGMANFRRALGAPLYWGALALLTGLAIVLGGRQGPVPRAILVCAGIAAPALNIAALCRISQAWHAPDNLVTELSWTCAVWGTALLLTAIGMRQGTPGRTPALLALATVLIARLLAAAGATGPLAWSAALLLAGLAAWLIPALQRERRIAGWRLTQALAALSILYWALAAHAGGDATLWTGFYVTLILIVANVLKMIPSILTAVVIHRLKSDAANYWYRVLFVVPMIIPGMVYLLIWKFFFEPNQVFNLVLREAGILSLLAHLDTWLHWGGIFQAGVNPVWLGSPQLVLPAMIIWGFPWVGVVGVLIYLAGLQTIDTSVYEAADLDGISPVGKFFHIELPLILAQVRINLVLMIIGTLQSYGFVLILFGEAGGPNGKLMIPGLYMFRQAFIERYVGYACCLGLVLFVFILILTEINNRYLRVEK